MKKQSNLSRLLQIAGNHKYLTLCFMGAFGNQRPYRIGALLLYLENHPGSVGGCAGFQLCAKLDP